MIKKILFGLLGIIGLFIMPAWADETCANLFTTENAVDGKFYSATGQETNGVYTGYTFNHTDFIPVQSNVAYNFSITCVVASQNNHRIIGWDENKNFVSQELNLVCQPEDFGQRKAETFETSNTVKYITINYMIYPTGENTEFQLAACSSGIKIATTKYTETQFTPIDTALANAVAAVNTVVSNTITQAASIATLHANKQTRPADDSECPAGKKCLLVTDENNVPHWYEICTTVNCLPAGYTELEYLQTDGNSWIDTRIKGDMSYKYEIDFQQLDARQYRNWGVFNQYSYDGGPNMSLTYAGGFTVRWTVSGASNQLRDVSSSLDANRHHMIIDNGYVTWDGVSKGRSGGHRDNYMFNYNLFLGTINPGGTTPTSNAKSKYYSYKVWNASGNLIQNFIPARDSGGVVGMYDTVSGTFFTNAGTGTFVAGPAVE